MNLFKLGFANVRKNKGSFLMFFLMVMLSALVLSCSLSLMVGSSDFYERKVERLNAPHYTNFVSTALLSEELLEYAQGYEGTSSVSVMDTLFCEGNWHAKKLGDGTLSRAVFFCGNQKPPTLFTSLRL